MRGRKPMKVVVSAADRAVLERIAHRRQLPWFQVQRARVILALAAGARTEELAACWGCDRRTIGRLGERYRQGGIEGLLSERPRAGRPPTIFPDPAGPDRGTGLLGTHCRGAAPDALVQRRSGATGHRRAHR